MQILLYTNPKISEEQLNLLHESINLPAFNSKNMENEDGQNSEKILCLLIRYPVTFLADFEKEIKICFTKLNSGILYSDHLAINFGQKVHVKPPSWSPIRFLNTDYLGSVVGIFLPQMDTPTTYEDLQNVIATKIKEHYFDDHFFTLIKKPLYQQNVNDHDSQDSFHEQIQELISGDYSREFSKSDSNSKIDIIIPTRLGTQSGENKPIIYSCIDSIQRQISRDYTVSVKIVLDENSDVNLKNDFIDFCGNKKNIEIKMFSEDFNFSRKCNIGAIGGNSEFLVFLNDDTEFVDNLGLINLVESLHFQSVGATGALLLYPDRSIQHAGHVFRGGNIAHAFLRMLPEKNEFGDIGFIHEVSSVTGACIALKRSVFYEVGKWNENFPNSFNDVDLCLRLRQLNYKILQNNLVTLIHHESISRDPLPAKKDLSNLKSLWMAQLFEENFLRSDIAFEGNLIFGQKPESPTVLYYLIRLLQNIKSEGFRRTTWRVIDFTRNKIFETRKFKDNKESII